MDQGLKPNWPHVIAFLGLTFGLTWLLDLIIYLHGGLNIPGIAVFTNLQTLLPAFCAILLGLFFFPESPIHRRRPAGKTRWFFYYYELMTIAYATGALSVLFNPLQAAIELVAVLIQVLAFLGLVLLVVLRFWAGRQAMAGVWLSWGKMRYWLLFAVGLILYYAVQAALNAFFGLGGASLTVIGSNSPIILILAGVQSVLLLPLLAILVFFGEEYAWRGYLQNELVKLGPVKGILLVGLIWGAWHWPIILMGVNYPGHPLLGVLLNTLNTTGLAVVLGFAVLKSKSVLLAAFLHGITDQLINFIVALGFRPYDPAFAFGIGIYGIVLLAFVALIILRDPIWKQRSTTFSVASSL